MAVLTNGAIAPDKGEKGDEKGEEKGKSEKWEVVATTQSRTGACNVFYLKQNKLSFSTTLSLLP